MATKKTAPKKEEPKPVVKKEDPSYDELIDLASRKMAKGPGIVSTHWQNVRDALVQANEIEKRAAFILEGRVTEGDNANKNVVRETQNRVE